MCLSGSPEGCSVEGVWQVAEFSFISLKKDGVINA